MMWKPVLRLDEIADLARLHAEGRVLELGHHASPAEVIQVAAGRLRTLVLRVFLCERREVGARLYLLQNVLGLLANRSFVLALGLQQDVAGAHLFRRLELLDVVVVVALDLGRRDRNLLTHLRFVDQQELDLAALADAVLGLPRVEVARDVRVRQRDLVAELVGGQRDELKLHLLVARLVLVPKLCVAERHPVGEGCAELLERHASPHALLELGGREGRSLAPQNLNVPLLAYELAVLLKGRERQDLGPQLFVADGDAVAFGFGQRRLLVDHLLQDLLLDPELPQELRVDVAAVGLLIRLHLRLETALELACGHVAPLDGRHDLSRRCARRRCLVIEEVGEEIQGERHNQQNKAPFEPVPVPAHPVEHRHISPRKLWDKAIHRTTSGARLEGRGARAVSGLSARD